MPKKPLSAGGGRGTCTGIGAYVGVIQAHLGDLADELLERLNRRRSSRVEEWLVLVWSSMARLNRLRIAVAEALEAMEALGEMLKAEFSRKVARAGGAFAGEKRVEGRLASVWRDGRAEAGGRMWYPLGGMIAPLERLRSGLPRPRDQRLAWADKIWRDGLDRAIGEIGGLAVTMGVVRDNWLRACQDESDQNWGRCRVGRAARAAENALGRVWSAMGSKKAGLVETRRRVGVRHTLGPWSVSIDFEEKGHLPHVYVLHGARGAKLDQASANLRLIVAAPRMREVLMELFANRTSDLELARRYRKPVGWVRGARALVKAMEREKLVTYAHEYFEGADLF